MSRPPTPRLAVAALIAAVLTLALLHPAGRPVGATVRAGPATGPDPGATHCTQDWRPAVAPTFLDRDGAPSNPERLLAPAPTPEHRAFHLFCDTHYVTTVWLARPTGTVEAARVAREIVAGAEWPSVTLGVHPTLGVTGLPSWFWATPQPGTVVMVPGNGPALTLEVRVSTVQWSFGDHSAGARGLGAAYPAVSPVLHTWTRTGSYTVTATVVLAGRFWFEELVDALPAGGHRRVLRHDVGEIRSLLHTV